MEKLVICGGRRLSGEIDVQGAKNSALPILAATVLIKGESVIHNCPDLSDIDAAIKILKHLGCKVKKENNTLMVDSREISCYNIPDTLMREMRSSIVFLGSVLGRMGKAVMSSPGGCDIGLRPIDLHLSSLRTLGIKVDECHGTLICTKEKPIVGGVVSLSFPSVGATENIMLACALSEGRTVILNAAREPEIKDLADFLNSCGCNIEIGSHGTVAISGVSELHECEHHVISDRIASLTFMSAVAASGGDVILKKTDTSSFMSVIPIFEQMGCEINNRGSSLRIKMHKRPEAVLDIRTMPYPGFPTDAQAPVTAVLSIAKGTSVLVENIFENRFKHIPELQRMGAKIKIEGKVAIIDGTAQLYGAKVISPDLRGGAALVVAGLSAAGTTVVEQISHIDRGYENIEKSLSALGADIKRVKV
ncbi:MAG: UDP-N-acetylglucosamine 1-carboxyvinyltransferase [Clostridia bacterium]|nr:UDP-N-acetylglucosamine 1-carboxyvinyltransferase [Clostridia bacterium]